MSLNKKIKKFKRKLRIMMNRPGEKRGSQSIDISGIKTICIVLGPYRNLTTLTASIMSLHPNCQVLNHGLDRIKGDKSLNFLTNYSSETLANFLKYAIYISGGGKRGNYGGSITFSHAYAENNQMGESYRELYGDQLVKDDIQSLFWKESLYTTNILQQYPDKFQQILKENPTIKFILPVRNTLDCAESNIKTGMATIYPEIKDKTNRKKIIQRIMQDYHWFFELKANFPDRFFYYFQHEMNRNRFIELAKFLNISADETWLQYCLKNYQVRSKYDHSKETREFFSQTVCEMFTDFPAEKEELLRFTGE